MLPLALRRACLLAAMLQLLNLAPVAGTTRCNRACTSMTLYMSYRVGGATRYNVAHAAVSTSRRRHTPSAKEEGSGGACGSPGTGRPSTPRAYSHRSGPHRRGYAPGGVSHSVSSLHGGFICARGVLDSQKWRFPAGQLQGATAEGDAVAVAVRGGHNAIDCALSRPVPMTVL